MFKKFYSLLLSPIKRLLLYPPFRYKFLFSDIIHPHPDELILKSAFSFANHSNVGGDYLEFGVWKGRSFARAYNIWKHLLNKNSNLKDMRFYAFDSFEGLPEITSQEDKVTGEFKKGEYNASVNVFKEYITEKGVALERVEIIKGWYSEVLNDKTKKRLALKKAAVIFVDSDLYESAVQVLDFVTNYIADGTVIIFDDWFCFRGNPNHGEQLAFRDWLSKYPEITASEYQRFNWKGNSFILHKQ